jgi:hypothetical protein
MGGGGSERPPLKIKDYVQWTSNGINQFKPVRKITKIEGGHAWVYGSMTGIPMNDLTIADPPATPTPHATGTSENDGPN